jgi:hypothetical protein
MRNESSQRAAAKSSNEVTTMRNAPTREEVLASLTPEQRQVVLAALGGGHHAIRVAHEDGRCCATCGGELDDQADVWLRNTFYTSHGYECYSIAPHCTACAEKWLADRQGWRPTSFRPPVPCAGCGRAVHLAHDWVRRRRIVCSERYRAIAHNAARRQQRQAARQRTCAPCGSRFTPRRRDGRFCSTACRMRAYRWRHAS